jgi:hypothetical protein
MNNIQKLVETEFLRRSTPEEINDMFRQLKDKMDELEQENAKLKAKLHNTEEGLRRLDILVLDGAVIKEGFGNTIDLVKYAPMSSCRSLMRIDECSTLADLIDAIAGGK